MRSRLEQLHNAELADEVARQEMLAGNDVGVLFYEGGPSVISVFTNQNRGDFFDLEATLGRIAEESFGSGARSVNRWRAISLEYAQRGDSVLGPCVG